MDAIDNILFNEDAINLQSDSLVTQAKATIESLNGSINATRPNFISDEDAEFDEGVIRGLRQAVSDQEGLIERINARRSEMLEEVKKRN